MATVTYPSLGNPGDTVRLPATLAGEVTLPGERTYVGNVTGNCVLKFSGVKMPRVQGVTLNGGGVSVGNCDGAVVDGCTITNPYTGTGVYLGGGNDYQITYNRITGAKTRGIWFPGGIGSRNRINDNTLIDCNQGIQGEWRGKARDNQVCYNEVVDPSRHGIELQHQNKPEYNNGTPAEPMDGLLVEGNYVRGWTDNGGGGSSMRISCATGGYEWKYARNVVIRGNVLIAGDKTPKAIGRKYVENGETKTIGATNFTAIEGMGAGTLIEDNYSLGNEMFHLSEVTDGCTVRNNTFVGTATSPAGMPNAGKLSAVFGAKTRGNKVVEGNKLGTLAQFPIPPRVVNGVVKYGPRDQSQSGVGGVTRSSAPTWMFDDDFSVVTFGGLEKGDNVSVHGADRTWHNLNPGGAGGSTFVWRVTEPFHDWKILGVKRNGALESEVVPLTVDGTRDGPLAQLKYAPVEVPASEVDALKARLAEANDTIKAQSAKLLDAAASLESHAKALREAAG